MVTPAKYAELHAHSAFTFMEAVDFPERLVERAVELGLSGLAVLDVDGMYSAVQTARAGKVFGLPIVHGTELTLQSVGFTEATPLRSPGPGTTRTLERGQGLPAGSVDPGIRLPVLATSQVGYHALCSLLSTHFLKTPGRRKAGLQLSEVSKLSSEFGNHGLLALTGTSHGPLQRAIREHGLVAARGVLEHLKEIFGPDGVAVELPAVPHAPKLVADQLALLAKEADLPLVATGAVRSSDPSRAPLSDVLTATRLGKPLDQVEGHLQAFQSFLRTPDEMVQLFARYPEAVENAAFIAAEAAFDLRIIDPGLPHFPLPAGGSEAEHLRQVTYLGARYHYGTRTENPAAWKLIDHELEIIEQLGFPGYFLIVKDIVDFCAEQNILCQGRGSAANSAVCYALGITAVDAVKHKMLFERFLSPDRKEAPDIDLDIEASEREQVIQYVYEKYGRQNAAQVANVITYRPKSAIRDAGKALGYSDGIVRRWTKFTQRGGLKEGATHSEIPEQVLQLAAKMQKLPRHMGLHPGGMVLTRRPISQVCPVMWAAKENRSVLQWDKEDCADAGLVKFDLLGLGMLTALRKAYTWLEAEGVGHRGRPISLHNTPSEDPLVYDLLCAAETVGVFQVESRAQMNTLPRLKPRCFYDIVIEVALIRPGPIQGRAVNPYLRRKNGREPVTYSHELLKPALEKTLGVPLFQEQLMQIAVDGAGFSPGLADQLRRAIGSKRSEERMASLKPALFEGMKKNGIGPAAREEIFEQLKGFAQFGFPESHAFSFAYLVYASAWLKVHYPEHFYAALLASQPMGFYSPASLVADAKRHKVAVFPPSVAASQVGAVPVLVDPHTGSRRHSEALVHADESRGVRLGFESIKGLGKGGERIVTAREEGPFSSLSDLASRAKLSSRQLEKLSAVGALEDLGYSRREGLWAAGALGQSDWTQPFIPGTEPGGEASGLPPMTRAEQLVADYGAMNLSLDHPLAMVRESLTGRRIIPLVELASARPGQTVQIAGLVTHRQRPSTAGGTTFLSLEDETGLGNVICSKGIWLRFRQVALESKAMIIRGRVEKDAGSVAVVAESLRPLLIPVAARSRDFR